MQLPGDGVVAVELGIVEDGHEHILGEDVLDEHLAHVGHFHAGIDGLLAQLQEFAQGLTERDILGVLLFNDGAQLGCQGGDVLVELLDGAVELADLERLVGDEAGKQRVEGGDVGKSGAQDFGAVLVEHGGMGVFEQNVVGGVALGELGRNLGVEVVLLVLGLPVAPILAQRVL